MFPSGRSRAVLHPRRHYGRVFLASRATQCAVELDDLIVDSIRNFDPDSQVSIKEADSCEIFAGKLEAQQSLATQLS